MNTNIRSKSRKLKTSTDTENTDGTGKHKTVRKQNSKFYVITELSDKLKFINNEPIKTISSDDLFSESAVIMTPKVNLNTKINTKINTKEIKNVFDNSIDSLPTICYSVKPIPRYVNGKEKQEFKREEKIESEPQVIETEKESEQEKELEDIPYIQFTSFDNKIPVSPKIFQKYLNIYETNQKHIKYNLNKDPIFYKKLLIRLEKWFFLVVQDISEISKIKGSKSTIDAIIFKEKYKLQKFYTFFCDESLKKYVKCHISSDLELIENLKKIHIQVYNDFLI